MNRIAAWTEPYAPLARRVLPVASLVTLFAIGAQFVLAGIMVFFADIAGIHGSTPHKLMGGVIHGLVGLLLAAALVGRQPRALIGVSGALFVVATVMMALPRAASEDIKAFHPLGALLVFWLTYVVYQRSRATERATAELPEAAAVAPTA